MKEQATDAIIEIVKNTEPNALANALIWVSIAVIIVMLTIIVSKYIVPLINSDNVKKLKITSKDLEFYKKLANNLSNGVLDLASDHEVLKEEFKEIRINQVEHTKLIDKISTHMEVQTQLLMQKLK